MPMYSSRDIKLTDIATEPERLSIPHLNTVGGLKLQNIRFMENFEPNPKVAAVGQPWDHNTLR